MSVRQTKGGYSHLRERHVVTVEFPGDVRRRRAERDTLQRNVGAGLQQMADELVLERGLGSCNRKQKKKKIVKTYVYCIYVRILMYIFTTVVRRLLLLRVYSSYVIVSAITRTPRQWLIARTYERDIDLAKEQKKEKNMYIRTRTITLLWMQYYMTQRDDRGVKYAVLQLAKTGAPLKDYYV